MPSPKRFPQDEGLELNDLRCYRCWRRSCHRSWAQCESVWTGLRSMACAKHQALAHCDSHQVQKIQEELNHDNSQQQRCSTHWSLDSEDQEVWNQILVRTAVWNIHRPVARLARLASTVRPSLTCDVVDVHAACRSAPHAQPSWSRGC